MYAKLVSLLQSMVNPHVIFTVALKYTLSRFEVVDDSTELSLIQLSSAQLDSTELSSVHRAQLSSTALSSIQLSPAQFS